MRKPLYNIIIFIFHIITLILLFTLCIHFKESETFSNKMFSLPTAPQFLRADRHGQPLFVAFSPALISAISAFISTISALSFSSHSSRVWA